MSIQTESVKSTSKVKRSFSIERALEGFLWNFRYIIILAIFGLLLGSVVVFVMGLFEVFSVVGKFVSHWFNYGPDFTKVYKDVLLGLIVAVDDFLLGIVLIIFGLGTYDLFISHINPAEQQDDVRPDWLVFSSLDELKGVLGKVVLMIMIITFLKHVVGINEIVEKINLLYVAISIALIALALKWSHDDHNGAGHDIDRSTMADRLKQRHQQLHADTNSSDSHGSH
ncbi:MAG TPA: YqhA family protein [Anaerolineae bacterium]|nr:YqhA family protein [Anaerolineae bacterium]HRV93537.1 YqhA family protein [Anaerolineae bacterium]